MMMYEKKETLLKVENVSLQYGEKKILSNINFEIKNIVRPNILQGQVVSLVGRSGIGKTQLFKILAGLNKPTTGSVTVGQTQREVYPGDMGIVFQNYLLFNWRTIQQNLELAASKNPQLKNEQDIKLAIQHHVDAFHMTEHIKKYPQQLSGGQRQRISIIQQLLSGGDFLLLDEPFSGLDSLVIDKVLDMLLTVSLSDEIKTLIIVSHDLRNSVALSDTVFLLGKIDENEGATIIKEIDLIERGLAWNKDVKHTPEFVRTIDEIKSLL